MISFCLPCLQWKFIVAIKAHEGWSGFLPPYHTKYLHRIDKTTFSTGVLNREQVIDRLTGQLTEISGPGYDIVQFGPPPFGGPNWTVRDDYLSFLDTVNGIHYESTLDQPYELTTLNADADNLIATIDPAGIPWGNLVEVDLGVPIELSIGGVNEMMSFLPLPYQFLLASAPVASLGAAAAYIFFPGTISNIGLNFQGCLIKLVGFIKMAGNYCQKTYYIDFNQNVLSHLCLSGKGSCAAPGFRVNPPPVIDGQNAYVLIVPNCQCSSPNG